MQALIAIDDNYGMGKDGNLPWPHQKEDMKFFRRMTVGKTVVMGRTTFEGMGRKPLPNRMNLVLTSKFFLPVHENLQTINSISEIPTDAIVIGGKAVYLSLLDKIDEFYVSIIKGIYDVDTRMPYDFLDGFKPPELVEKHDTLTVLKYTK